MIVRIKKRDLAIASISLIFIMSLIFSLSIPLIYAQTQAGFAVWLSILNRNPTIKLINATGFAVDPVAGGNAPILISFNVTDADGEEDINGTNGGSTAVVVNLTLGTPSIAQFRTYTSCVNTTPNVADTVTFTCTVDMKHYDNNSAAWVINISVVDANGGTATNATKNNEGAPHVFTYNSLSSFSIRARDVSEGASINFSGLNLGAQNQPAKAPLLLNNTGNADFDMIRILAANLVGITTSSETIAASSFFVNATNGTAGAGVALSATANVTLRALLQSATDTLDNVSLLHGPGISGDSAPYPGVADSKTKGNQTLVFWVDVPSSGLSAQVYNNTWNMTVIDLP